MKKRKPEREPKRQAKTPPKPNIPPSEQAILADIYRTLRKMYSRPKKGRRKRK